MDRRTRQIIGREAIDKLEMELFRMPYVAWKRRRGLRRRMLLGFLLAVFVGQVIYVTYLWSLR